MVARHAISFVGTFTDYQVLLMSVWCQVQYPAYLTRPPPAAFVGSTWQLTNSGNGIYTLADGTSQTIYWSLNDNNQTFQFKKIFEGDKS